MESIKTFFTRGAICQKVAVDDAELSSWKRKGQWERIHYFSESHSRDHYKVRQLSELLSYGVDHSSFLGQSVIYRTPKCTRKSSLPCSAGKKYPFHRSASGLHLSTTAGSVYAGARFSEAPSPKLLPLPPRHWLDEINEQKPAVCGEMTKHLKSVLQVE